MWVLAQCTFYPSHSCYFILIHWLFRMVSNSQIQLFTTKWCFDLPGMFWYGDHISLLFLKALCQSGSCHNLSKILIYHSSPSIHIVISSHVISLCRVPCTSFVHWRLWWAQEPATSLRKISALYVSGTTESSPIFLDTSHLTLECLFILVAFGDKDFWPFKPHLNLLIPIKEAIERPCGTRAKAYIIYQTDA